MKNSVTRFCSLIRQRSQENERAIQAVSNLPGPSFSILRQEIDSMVRVIFLLSIEDVQERVRLIELTLNGERWKVQTKNKKWKDVTDKELVELADNLNGWTRSVYKFGCGFIHLSVFHNYISENPFKNLSRDERSNIVEHLRYYHGGFIREDFEMNDLLLYIPSVFEKIKSNLDCYLKDLESEKKIIN